MYIYHTHAKEKNYFLAVSYWAITHTSDQDNHHWRTMNFNLKKNTVLTIHWQTATITFSFYKSIHVLFLLLYTV